MITKLTIALGMLVSITASGLAQQVKPGMDYPDRLELARKMYEPIRAAVVADPNSDARSQLTPYWVRIDPEWTAKFIIANPVPRGELLFDNMTIRWLMEHPDQIPEAELFKLLEQQSYHMLFFGYAYLAAKSLPPEKQEQRDKIVAMAMGLDDPKLMGFASFGSRILLAKLSGDPEVQRKVESSIKEYYTSGRAQTAFDALKKRTGFQSDLNAKYYSNLFARHAPEELKSGFQWDSTQPKKQTAHVYQLSAIINDDSLSDSEKTSQFRQIEAIDFGIDFDVMMTASQLGGVALYDSQLALKWAGQAPDPRAKIWAKLTIAVSVVKRDQAAADSIVRECYDEISKLDSSMRSHQNHSYPPAFLASSGLRLVHSVNPELLEDCIATTIELIQPLSESSFGNAHEQVFEAIARIARYDQASAGKLFEEYSDDVSIDNCVGFFRALTALHPDEFWDEFQGLLDEDDRGAYWNVRVESQLIPALVEEDDTRFWDALSPLESLSPGDKVLGR